MQLVEVMVAASVFAMATGSSVQLWSRAALGSQQVEMQQQQAERVELDRLQLQARWQAELRPSCSVSPAQLITVAERVPVPPQLRREVVPVDQGAALQVRWWLEASPANARERLFTAAGLGLCDPVAAAEEVVP
ncbi:hypothetical protein KUL97_07260 [Synechococcus sp. HK05]|uniref:hypothetical protein n=1 Tax=Synechococcus sp. HK05 TaxID=2725975 RepID=UPI001C383A74|nr:hypothetical protein [Synechococcus sp. HK05]MBV2351504.1 hypothetical protein [Synechococcus sp. HK05]